MRSWINAVVISLAGLLTVGLLTAVVAKMRDAAAKSNCSNNSRQIVSAAMSYSDTNQRTPFAGRPNADLSPEERLSWLVEILPFVESNPEFIRIDRELGWNDEKNRYLGVQDLKFFYCPAERDRVLSQLRIPTSYIGMTGVGKNAIARPKSGSKLGFFGYDRSWHLEEIPRATSAVIVTLETQRHLGAWSASGPPTCRGLVPSERPYLGKGRPFGGIHREVTIATFADGSVRSLSSDMSPEVLEEHAIID